MVTKDNRTIIQLDEHWRIESDVASWNLMYEEMGGINAKTGKPSRSRDASYHANLRYALQSYIDESLKDKGRLDISELLERIKEAEQNVEKAVLALYEKLK